MSSSIPEKILKLARAVRDEGGRALMVGGCVRDRLMGREANDWDVEVYGVEPARLRELLDRLGRVNVVGEAFTVYKLGQNLDVSIPRRERKMGRGHRAFFIEGDPAMSVEDAARRRDFTVNAILEDPLDGELLDPFGGREDLRRKLLRAVAPETFVEDSLRVLRAAQFAARFDFDIEPATIELCRSIDLTDLPAERIWGEMEKILLVALQPSIGLRWLDRLGVNEQLFPELHALKGVPQDSEWHPEGWVLTAMSPESFVARMTQPSSVERRMPTLREFLAGSATHSTVIPTGDGATGTQPAVSSISNLPTTVGARSDNFGETPVTVPAILTESESLMWFFGTPASRTDKIVRVMFKVALDNVRAVVRRAVNDFEVVRGVVHPVAVFVMNMLPAFKPAPQYHLHDDTVQSRGSAFTISAGVHVASVVVDARATTVDNNILFYFDLALVGNGNFIHEGESPIPSQWIEVKIGDVFYHTQLTCDRARELVDDLDYPRRATVMLAALCHDFGKPSTTEFIEGRIRSRGHEEAGVAPTLSMLDRLKIFTLDGYDVRSQTVALVRDHLKPGELYRRREELTDGAFRRLARRCELELLYRVAKADTLGRNASWLEPERWYDAEAQEWFIERARELAVERKAPAPLLLGRHLLEMGLKPSPRVGEIARAVYEMQLDGRVRTLEDAKEEARALLDASSDGAVNEE